MDLTLAGQGESPAVARRRVRLALRRARDAKGLSQGAVAASVGWSLSKVQRIESGDNAISGTDLRALLNLYGITDDEEVEQLLEEARISRRQRWWATPEFREHLTPGTMQLLQFEAEAVAIRSYQSVVVPGPFQIPAYARLLLGWFNKSLTEEQRRVRFDVRMQRRERLLESPDSPQYYLILDESVLKREVGGLEVMAQQLEFLAELAGRPGIHVRIVPLNKGAMLGTVGQFTVLDLAEDEDDAVLYRESFAADFISHDRREIAVHREMFEFFWLQSLNDEKTIRAISAEAASLRARIDRESPD
ncbi:helix-turn-helix domain-containing protein [Actinoplanes sp. NPDC051513]|uniref:helix-turn-helix domain-containing protein n=1 Tax=Actinoplanes sp. NPDC051513 TaxID=3363908 RepID=UPI0037A88C94